ncbi:hypothetical protein FN846DRAFT_955672 [Sphaerosporella brunnea]|uniref:Lanthionine synthetase C-like protein n=1 Tax=Sphaerosporella brunnea TaxID=1250544 RepID=A0A5J5EU23_9PEZI|nr:hypothetical protein FN846DRAFT_955672 [Sphaerosporella brunnea]
MNECRYYENRLTPPALTEDAKEDVLIWLRTSAVKGISIIEANTPHAGSDSHDHLYTGHSGIALAYIRLAHQLPELEVAEGFDYPKLVQKHLSLHHRHAPHAGKLSPIGSVTGAALVAAHHQLLSLGDDAEEWEKAMVTLGSAVQAACESDEVGGDEVLYGRAGLLWAIMNFQKLGGRAEEGVKQWGPDIVPTIVRKIIESGTKRTLQYMEATGDHNEGVLMWEWHGKMYLGAMHGAAGILTVLLQVPREVIEPYLPEMITTVKALCRLTLDNDGHLPSAIPVHHRSDPYVQICHGSPGLVILLVALKQFAKDYYEDDLIFGNTLQAAAQKVWEQGLVKKGLGICHGVAGNAWALMLYGRVCDGICTKELWLSRGLALLMKTTEMPPMVPAKNSLFRLPDVPLSLFEGLAGTVAAYAEAYNLVKGDDERVLGFPGLGGKGVMGYF